MNVIKNIVSRFIVPNPPQEFTDDFDSLMSELWEPAREAYASTRRTGYSEEHRQFARLVRLSAQRFGHSLTPEQIIIERLGYAELDRRRD